MTEDLLQEVKEDIRQEQLLKLWRKYGTWIIIGIAVILMGTAATIGWQQWSDKKQQEHARLFLEALRLEQEGTFPDAQKKYEELTHTSGGFAMLAGFRLASLETKIAGHPNIEGVSARLKWIETATQVSKEYRDLATLLRMCLLVDSVPASTLLQELEPLAKTDGPWRVMALELKGLLLQQDGQTQLAAAIFTELASRSGLPPALDSRIRAFAQQVKSLLDNAPNAVFAPKTPTAPH